MDDIIKKCTSKSKKARVGHINLDVVQVSEGAFADNIVIIADNENDLKRNLTTWNMTLKNSGMIMNKSKTKVRVVGDEPVDTKIEIEGIKIEQLRIC